MPKLKSLYGQHLQAHLAYAIIFFVFIITLGQATNASGLSGSIQITTEPGVKIWLNEAFYGDTNFFENGLFINNVPVGTNSIKAVKFGFQSLVEQIEVIEGQTTELVVVLSAISNESQQHGTKKTTYLFKKNDAPAILLQSIPLHAEVFIDEVRLGETDMEYQAAQVGKHNLRFVYKKLELSTSISLEEGDSISVLADFKENNVKIVNRNLTSEKGPALIKLQEKKKKSPVSFPHLRHQEMFTCNQCHHSVNANMEKTPYIKGQEIKKCASCHNLYTNYSELTSFKQAAHALCKTCHRNMANSGKAGPIDKCVGCHLPVD